MPDLSASLLAHSSSAYSNGTLSPPRCKRRVSGPWVEEVRNAKALPNRPQKRHHDCELLCPAVHVGAAV
eukprot:4678838-Prymnesium_polylepis.1